MDQTKRIIETFNSFDGKNLNQLDEFYAKDIAFCDPVGEVHGIVDLKKYYEHAYGSVKSIRFDFGTIVQDGETYACPWIMTVEVKNLNSGKPYRVHGMSHLKFNENEKVNYHRDYLDVGEMVYERLPVIGFAVRKFKSLLKGPAN